MYLLLNTRNVYYTYYKFYLYLDSKIVGKFCRTMYSMKWVKSYLIWMMIFIFWIVILFYKIVVFYLQWDDPVIFCPSFQCRNSLAIQKSFLIQVCSRFLLKVGIYFKTIYLNFAWYPNLRIILTTFQLEKQCFQNILIEKPWFY